jgi:hypothetical protein
MEAISDSNLAGFELQELAQRRECAYSRGETTLTQPTDPAVKGFVPVFMSTSPPFHAAASGQHQSGLMRHRVADNLLFEQELTGHSDFINEMKSEESG